MSEVMQLNPIERLTKDIKNAAVSLSNKEARYLVDAYYIMQEDRKRSYNQERSLAAADEPNMLISWLAKQSETLEGQIKNALDAYTKSHIMGSWMREIHGIGPVISAGMLAHINIKKSPTAGHIWSYAGIAGDTQKKWEKNQKRPFNAKLKTLCWKAGQSFMNFSNVEDCYYGLVYRKRKASEVANNEAGLFAAQAAAKVGKVGKDTEAFKAYSAGKLPPAHIDARARRYAVKLFLSHLQGEWYQRHYGVAAPLPYPIAIMGHAHYIPAPTKN